MLIAIIGGKLQGVEAVYLAQKAGWKTLVIDRNPNAPAIGLCDDFLAFEFSPGHCIPTGCPKPDFILPAVEDTNVLTASKTWAETENIPLAFDMNAYGLSSSKLKSDMLFKKMNLPAPGTWPDCGFPVVVKPDRASGSQGVEVVYDSPSLLNRFPTREAQNRLVIQEYIEGPSYSIEVVGRPGRYRALQVTDLYMDASYDCKRVIAPTQLPVDKIRQFEEMAVAIAEEIRLTGIMDVEVVLNKNELKLLEIDARLPSQTPMAVYRSTGINMVEMLGHLFLNQKIVLPDPPPERYTIVEHLRVSEGGMEILGEHIMSGDGPLTLRPGFSGADEAITSYGPGKEQWVATMIFSGADRLDVMRQRKKSYERILNPTEYTL